MANGFSFQGAKQNMSYADVAADYSSSAHVITFYNQAPPDIHMPGLLGLLKRL